MQVPKNPGTRFAAELDLATRRKRNTLILDDSCTVSGPETALSNLLLLL